MSPFRAKRVQTFYANPITRTSTQSTLEASAALPNSGLGFVDNSQGASAAVAELSRVLDDGIKDVDFGDDLRDDMKRILGRIDDGASKYRNADPKNLDAVEWACSREDAAFIAAAFECAVTVYNPDLQPNIDGFTCLQEGYIQPSGTGEIKSTSFTIVVPQEGYQQNHHLPALVVAVRGSLSKIDHIVNLNGEVRDASEFLSSPFTAATSAMSPPPMAHAGFLIGAKAIFADVDARVKALSRDRSVKHIILTGHSAGGAVASLLFAKFLLSATKYASLRFSLITFGSPPVISKSLADLLLSEEVQKYRGLALAMVNAYDLVTRSDTSYVRSLVNLFRLVFQRPPIIELPSAEATAPELLEERGSETSLIDYPLPVPDLWLAGQPVVLSSELAAVLVDGGQDPFDVVLKAYAVRPDEFVKSLFCRIDVHKRARYANHISMLTRGDFNGLNAWSDVRERG